MTITAKHLADILDDDGIWEHCAHLRVTGGAEVPTGIWLDGDLLLEPMAARLRVIVDARATELLHANNREVGRRRTMAHALRDMIECYREDADKPVNHEPDVIKQAFEALEFGSPPSRLPGLPTDITATAIGYSGHGRPWVLRHVDNGGGLPDGQFWVAVGFDEGERPSPRATGLFGQAEGLIVEHELVEVAS